MILPQHIDARAFDALHDDAPAWREVMVSIARGHGGGPVEQIEAGTVLVARIGDERMLKLYPPFLRDHFEFECAMLEALQGRLACLRRGSWRHRPEQTTLYRLVQQHAATFFAETEAAAGVTPVLQVVHRLITRFLLELGKRAAVRG